MANNKSMKLLLVIGAKVQFIYYLLLLECHRFLAFYSDSLTFHYIMIFKRINMLKIKFGNWN